MENSKIYADLARSRAVFYTPTVGSTLRELRQELPRLIDRVDICIDQHVRPKDGKPVVHHHRANFVELLIVDEVERLSTTALEYMRDLFDRHGVGPILTGMPGIEKRMAYDAAHVHNPVGGQGFNLGVQDAVNLGWKLAQVVHQTSPESLLDTYHAERHPVAARVLRNTMAQVALLRPLDDRIKAVRDTMSELLSMNEPRKRFAAMLSGLDIHDDLGEGHPLLGRRRPNLDVVTANGPPRVFTLLHDARPVLLNLDEPGGLDITPWADRVQLIDAKYVGIWELPVLGAVTAPTAVLIRPDGYVAWVGDRTHLGLHDALTTWFGPPTAA